jgi:hypothetical protein
MFQAKMFRDKGERRGRRVLWSEEYLYLNKNKRVNL